MNRLNEKKGSRKSVEELYSAIFAIRDALQDATQLAAEAAVMAEAFGGEIARVITNQLNAYFVPALAKYIDDEETPGAMGPLVTFLDSVPLAMTRQEPQPEQTTPAPIKAELAAPPTAAPAAGSYAAQTAPVAESRKRESHKPTPEEISSFRMGVADANADRDPRNIPAEEIEMYLKGYESALGRHFEDPIISDKDFTPITDEVADSNDGSWMTESRKREAYMTAADERAKYGMTSTEMQTDMNSGQGAMRGKTTRSQARRALASKEPVAKFNTFDGKNVYSMYTDPAEIPPEDLDAFYAMRKANGYKESDEFSPKVKRANTKSSDEPIDGEAGETWGVIRTAKNSKDEKPIFSFESEAEAKARADKLNSTLTAEEKQFYGTEYKAKKCKGTERQSDVSKPGELPKVKEAYGVYLRRKTKYGRRGTGKPQKIFDNLEDAKAYAAKGNLPVEEPYKGDPSVEANARHYYSMNYEVRKIKEAYEDEVDDDWDEEDMEDDHIFDDGTEDEANFNSIMSQDEDEFESDDIFDTEIEGEGDMPMGREDYPSSGYMGESTIKEGYFSELDIENQELDSEEFEGAYSQADQLTSEGWDADRIYNYLSEEYPSLSDEDLGDIISQTKELHQGGWK